MSNITPAQEEFANLVASSARGDSSSRLHPEDRDNDRRELQTSARQDQTEEDEFRDSQIDAAMRIPTFHSHHDEVPASGELKLPPASFDAGRTTGVKGVIADARAYEMARRSKWMNRVRAARRSVFGPDHHAASGQKSESETDEEGNTSDLQDEEAFLQQWRESRRRELETETSRSIRNRRTSPSVRVYGRMDEVDALGYLDAIEKVGRETVVVVFVYDHEVCHVLPRLSRP